MNDGLPASPSSAELRHAASAHRAADYERTWEANLEVTVQAFAEIEPLMERVRRLVLESNA